MRMMIKSVMAGALASLAAIVTSGAANAAPCPAAPTPLSTYLTGGTNFGCMINDKTFTFTNYSPTGGISGITSSMVNVTPIFTTNNPGFTLNGNWMLAAGTGDILLEFLVAALATHPVIDTTTSLFAVPTPTQTGSVTDSERVNGTLIFTLASPSASGTLNGAANLASLTSLDVLENIALVGGTGENLSVITKQFSETFITPEPASLAILAVSLLGMGAACRRFRK